MNKKKRLDDIVIENADIAYRNFTGKAGDYNPEGARNFCVFFDVDTGQALEADGWNIRWTKTKDPEEVSRPYLQVTVSFAKFAPEIVLIKRRGKQLLAEEELYILDWAEIIAADVVIRPSRWTLFEGTPKEKTGVKAYLDQLFITLKEKPFEAKYMDVPESAESILLNNGND